MTCRVPMPRTRMTLKVCTGQHCGSLPGGRLGVRGAHLTDRYMKAITQLASDKLEERLGGIYALECSRKPPDTAAAAMTRCLGSGGCCAAATNTTPRCPGRGC